MAGVYLKRGKWYARLKDGTGRWRGVATTARSKTEAKRLASDMERKAERQRFGLEPLPSDFTLTLAGLCEWWLRERCTERSISAESSRLGKHVIETRLGKEPLRFVTSARIDEHLRSMEKQGSSAASVNNLRKTMHAIFAQAMRADLWSGQNPVARVPRRRVLRRIYATLQAEEVPLLLAHVPDDWRDLFATALFTGMRKGELFALQKTDVDIANGVLIVQRSHDRNTTKGGHADVIPIARVLEPFLLHAMDESRCNLVFPGPGGKRRPLQAAPHRVLRHALARAGIVDGYDHICRRCAHRGTPHVERHSDDALRNYSVCKMKLWPRALPRPLRFHDLRHTTATLLLRNGVDAHRVQRILRHKDIETTIGIYGHLGVEDLRAGVDGLLGAGALPFATHLLPEPENRKMPLPRQGEIHPDSEGLNWRAMQDSNLRPLASEANALSS